MGYKELNLNPKRRKVGDCAIRAVAAALNISWDDAFKQLVSVAFDVKCTMSDVEAVDIVLRNNGFYVGKIKIDKGCRRPTVDSFSRQHPEWVCVLRVANHLVACGRGVYVDTWDSGDCAVYKYWYKPI